MSKWIWTAALGLACAAFIGTASAEAPEGVEVTVKGMNYCLVCAYGQGEASEDNAHYSALKVGSATDAEGGEVEGLAGKTLHYVPNAKADALNGEELRGKKVTVTGVYHADAQVIAVTGVEAAGGDEQAKSDGDGDDWDDWGDWDDLPIGSMSGQQVL